MQEEAKPKSVQKKLSKEHKLPHPRSRKVHKLTKLALRDVSREKSKLLYHVKQNMLGEKLTWFKENHDSSVQKYSPEMMIILIQRYLKRFDEELEQIKLKHSVGNRNKNRQHANREDIIKMTILTEQEEFNTCGLECPDLLNPKQLEMLRTWTGELRFLQNFKIHRYSYKGLQVLTKFDSLDNDNSSQDNQETSTSVMAVEQRKSAGNSEIQNSTEHSDETMDTTVN